VNVLLEYVEPVTLISVGKSDQLALPSEVTDFKNLLTPSVPSIN